MACARVDVVPYSYYRHVLQTRYLIAGAHGASRMDVPPAMTRAPPEGFQPLDAVKAILLANC